MDARGLQKACANEFSEARNTISAISAATESNLSLAEKREQITSLQTVGRTQFSHLKSLIDKLEHAPQQSVTPRLSQEIKDTKTQFATLHVRFFITVCLHFPFFLHLVILGTLSWNCFFVSPTFRNRRAETFAFKWS